MPRFMMLMYPNVTEEQYEAGVRAEDAGAMAKFNQTLIQAGVLLALDGLHPASKGARVTLAGGKTSDHRRPLHRGQGARRRLLADRRQVQGGGRRVGLARADQRGRRDRGPAGLRDGGPRPGGPGGVGRGQPPLGAALMASVVLKMSMSLDGYVEPADDDPRVERPRDALADSSGEWLLDTVEPRRRAPRRRRDLQGAGPTSGRSATPGRSPSGDERDPQGGVLEFPHVRRLAGDDDRDRRSGRGVTRLKQERSGGYLLAQAGVRFARSLVATGLDRRVPPRGPPDRARRGRAALHRPRSTSSR